MSTKIDEGIYKIYKFLNVTLPMQDPILIEEGLSFDLDDGRIIIGIEKFLNGYGVVIYRAIAHFWDYMRPFRDDSWFQRGIYVFSTMQKFGRCGYTISGGHLWEYVCREFKTPKEVIRFVLSKIFRV